MPRKTSHTELLVRIDERVEALTKNMEKVMPVVTEEVPRLEERVTWLQRTVLGAAGLYAIIKAIVVVAAVW
jgi:hypothetical protein